jgi:FtsZ-binding cell division protein ZapB
MAFRCFVSKQETKEKLEQYEDQLKKEFAGVRERIQELQGS